MPAVAWLLAMNAMWQQAIPVPPQSDAAPDTVLATNRPATPIGPVLPAFPARIAPIVFVADSATPQRPHAIEYSAFYEVRLTIHHYASFATLPLFAAEYLLGQSLINNPPARGSSTKQAHSLVAAGVAGLFGVNTVTGAWNLWDSRKDPSRRLRRYLHSALMIASDAGFVWTGATAPGDDRLAADPSRATLHRTIAISSMGAALAGYVMMLVWKD